MNFSRLLVPFSLALLTTWAIQYFFNPRNKTALTESSSGSFIKAPNTTQAESYKPLNLEIDFIDQKTLMPKRTIIESEKARYVFSTAGASLESLEFKRRWGHNEGYLSTVFEPSINDREKRCFLIALEDKTPYNYSLVAQKDLPDYVSLTYSASFEDGTIKKEYHVYKDLYIINLLITLEPNKPLQPRLFFPSPLVPQLGKDDWAKGLVVQDNKIKVYEKNEETLSGYWTKPPLFGTQDRYFINALISDPNHFTQRAYYKIYDLDNLYSILEGTSVSVPTTWKLSFYFGPKEDAALKKATHYFGFSDELTRLNDVLNYGWLGFISRPLSKIILSMLNFLVEYLKNYGLAIIVLTFLMKLLLVPFTTGNNKGQKKQREFRKQLKYIQEKYKNDKHALDQARAELIKKYGLPGMGGILSVLVIQVPLFITLSWVLSNSIELYKAPFLWINDLSAPDPYYILPILLFISMIFHSPSHATDSQQRFSMIAVGLIFAAFSVSLPAGLVLFILTSTVLGIIQAHMMRKFAE